jgi:hypothetical protein
VIRQSLSSGERRTVEIIEALGFGVIRGLSIRHGQPYYNPAPEIIQSIKLGSRPERLHGSSDTETLEKQFAHLFHHLGELQDGTVDIEVQHGLPFNLAER